MIFSLENLNFFFIFKMRNLSCLSSILENLIADTNILCPKTKVLSPCELEFSCPERSLCVELDRDEFCHRENGRYSCFEHWGVDIADDYCSYLILDCPLNVVLTPFGRKVN